MAYHKQPFISQMFISHLLCTRCCAGGDGVQQEIRPLPAWRVSHHCLHCSHGAPTSLHLPLALLPLSLGWERPPPTHDPWGWISDTGGMLWLLQEDSRAVSPQQLLAPSAPWASPSPRPQRRQSPARNQRAACRGQSQVL